ncbi:50S ribosomal protein L9 [Patescibacteria group bacterium]
MKVYLKKSVTNLGNKGDIVEVKDGYARNYLIPEAIAEVATRGVVRNAKLIKAQGESAKNVLVEKASEIKSALDDKTFEIKAKAGEKGTLFGSVTTKDIAQAISEDLDVTLPAEVIKLEKDIKEAGETKIPVKLNDEVEFSVNIKVTPEK